MASKNSRRKFLKQSALAGTGFWLAGGVAPAETRKSALEGLRFAGIGVGGKGSSDIDNAGKLGDVVAICDIDENTLEKSGLKFSKARKYFDFRKMLEEMEKEIDAVTISTPDHTHAAAAAMAMRLGKHVYVQKPLTHTVKEARVLRELAREKGVCTQMGNQGTAENGLREAVEIIRAGSIGQVKEVHVWTNRPIWPQSPKVKTRPTGAFEVPKHVKWDEFLGPSQTRPYAPGYHPFAWRGWWDFGTGALGDMACHTANMAFMALKLGYPSSLSAECEEINPETYPGWAHVTLKFPAREKMAPVTLNWYEGKKDGVLVHPPALLQDLVLPKNQEGKQDKLVSSGSILVGDKGILYSPNDYGGAYRLFELDGKPMEKPKVEQSLPRNGKGDLGMKAEWVEAIRGNNPSLAMSNFDYAGMLTESILLGNVAMKAGKNLEWDGPGFKFTNAPEANQHLHMEYRKGWAL
ncbi:MAG: Gfo/Idh/MocA family oxidoreductase [Gemmataceae bacterium]|nr:Gfo/Idh/MocA family oxidoreductase [Gemmataceae bacterium]